MAIDAHHHHLLGTAPSLRHVRGLGVSVAESWTGASLADRRDRLIAHMGRPAAYRKDGGSDLHKAADLLEARGLGSPCIDDLSHATAGMRKHDDQHPPAFERFLSACGCVSGTLTHTILACWAPPTGRTKARLMHVHRLCTGADRLLKLSPAGGAKDGSVFARLRACFDMLPACKDLSKRFRAEAQGLRACQKMLQTKGLSPDTLAQWKPLISEMPSVRLRLEFGAYLEYQRATAKPLGLDHVGLPISSDAIAALFGVAKRHGVGQTQDAARIALRLPALWGAPTREEAAQVLGISMARQHEITGQCSALTKQRREVRGHRKEIEGLGRHQGGAHAELLPSPKNRSNHAAIVNISTGCEDQHGPHLVPKQTSCIIENVGPPDMREAAVT